MSRRRRRAAPEPGTAVPTWPRIIASIDSDGRGELSWNSVTDEISAVDRDATRAAIVARCTRLAQTIARPVRLELLEGGRVLELAVHPRGTAQPIGADGVPAVDSTGDTDPATVVGTCRACSATASAAEARCQTCGAPEPLSRSRGGARRPSNAARNREEQASRTRTGRRALRRDAQGRADAPRALVIEFEDETRAVLAGGAAVGRDPSPVDGRIPVRVDSSDNTVSRTHALVDLDHAGRILVTDYHSTHGVHVSGKRATTLSPGVVYRVPDGTRLRLGDVLCRLGVSTAAASLTEEAGANSWLAEPSHPVRRQRWPRRAHS